MFEVFLIIYEAAEEELIFPYIESEDEYQTVRRFGDIRLRLRTAGLFATNMVHFY